MSERACENTKEPVQIDHYSPRPRALWAGLFLVAQDYPHIFATPAYEKLKERVNELEKACATDSVLDAQVAKIVAQVNESLS